MNYDQLKTDLMKLGIHEYNAEVIANHLGLDAHQRMSIEQAQRAIDSTASPSESGSR